MTSPRRLPAFCLAIVLLCALSLPYALTAQSASYGVDLAMVARIRDEGLNRSRVMDTATYITDVLGARLTLSDDADRRPNHRAEA